MCSSSRYCDTQVLQQAKQKKEAENPFSKPFKKMTDPVALRKMLRKELPRLVGHEQGLDLPSSKKVILHFSSRIKVMQQITQITVYPAILMSTMPVPHPRVLALHPTAPYCNT